MLLMYALKLPTHFHTARFNYISEESVRDILPNRYEESSNIYYINRFKIFRWCATSQYRSATWIRKAVEQIIERVGGHGFWEALTKNQRQELSGSIYSQYPLWALLNLHSHESKSVGFASIYSGVSADRKKFKYSIRIRYSCSF
jgi:hypothetical protein